MSTSLKKRLETNFRDIQIHFPEETRMVVSVQKEQVLDVLVFIKDYGYDHLALVSCVDWIDEKEFELVYIVSSYSIENRLHVILKTRIPRSNPIFRTVIPLFPNVEPYERELHELFGIEFEGHPRLIPLFLERNYKIPPFRKDFDSRNYVRDVFDAVPAIEEKK